MILLLASVDVDVVYAQDPVSVGLPAYWASRFLGRPLVVKVVGDYAWEQGVQRFGVSETLDEFVLGNKSCNSHVLRLKRIQKKVADGALRVFVPSAYLKNIVKSWGVDVGKIRVIYNAFDFSDLSGIKPNEITANVIVSVGRLVPWKGFDSIIDFMPEIRKHVSDARLVIIGDGPDRKRLQKKVDKLGLQEVVTLVGSLPHEQVAGYLRGARVFVLNTKYEGLSHTILEALALGAPVVTTNVGGNGELIEHGETGLLVEEGDMDGLKKAIIRMLTDEGLREKVKRAGVLRSRSFNTRQMIRSTILALEEICAY